MVIHMLVVRLIAEICDLVGTMNMPKSEVVSCLRREGLREVSINALAITRGCVQESER